MLPLVAKRENVRKSTATLQATVGIVVRTCRQNLGITQEELAWRADLHRTYIADVERGARNLSLQSIANLAAALQMTIGSLLTYASSGLSLRTEGSRTRKLREILLVEDDPADAELTLRSLKRAGLMNPVKTVDGGEEAIDYFFGTEKRMRRGERIPPLLVLLDLGLPKVSGLEVLRRMKSEERTRDIPIVVLTGSRHDRNITECARLGAANYIIKPVGLGDLSRVSSRLNMRWSLPGAAFPVPRPSG
jgi:CheY-like chemotaxis protein/DNA-binding XRE family transcriptional regulator